MAAEAAVSTAVLKLGDLLTRKADFLRGGGVIGEVQQLKDELKGVQCFLRDASGKQADDVAIRDWIAETGEVAHDAEDAVEVFIFKVERARIVLASFASSLKHKYLLKRFSRSINSIYIRKRLRGIDGRHSSLGIQDLGDRPRDGVESPKRLPKLSQWQKDKHIVGMEKDVELVLEKAILNEGDDISISAIVGEGGTGKSTLSRVLFNHAAVGDRFERRAWAVASKERRPRDIIKDIYLQVKSGETMEWELILLERLDLSEIKQRLYKRLEGKTYFIVLDDMWDDPRWNDAIAGGFPDEDTGSRFLLTLRTPDLKDNSGYVHTMKFLDSEESWILFMNTVSGGKGVDQDLEDIGRQILNKCDGLPLAITLVGGLLMKLKRSKTEWEKVLEEMESHLNRSSNNTMHAMLELSYQNLPPELKSCFLSLGIFELGDTIMARKLVDVWISEGFIPEEAGKTMEGTAMAYLDELIDRNMVQIKDISFDDRVKNCVTHDLVRDLSIRKAEEEILHEDGESSHKPRHRVLDCREGRFNDSIYGNKEVRSLVVRRGAQPYLFTPSFSSYWMSFQLLKLLDFECCMAMTQLPVSIGALMGLKYLNLRNTGMKHIPNWLPRLVNLEVLDIRGLVRIELSDILGKMIRLRRLYASAFYFEKPPEITSLKFLEALSYVNFEDANIHKVTHITSLSELGVNVLRISDSTCFFLLLGKMENLVHLKLKFCETLNLEKLGSLHRLTRLKLHGEITVFPSAFPPNLSHLTLDRCQLKEDPMPLLQRLPKLSHLKVDSAYEGAEMVISHDGFPELKVLILLYLIRLKSILVEEGAMPELRRLEINQSWALERLPEEMTRNLEELKVVASKKIAAMLRGEDSHMISNIPYLQILDATTSY